MEAGNRLTIPPSCEVSCLRWSVWIRLEVSENGRWLEHTGILALAALPLRIAYYGEESADALELRSMLQQVGFRGGISVVPH